MSGSPERWGVAETPGHCNFLVGRGGGEKPCPSRGQFFSLAKNSGYDSITSRKIVVSSLLSPLSLPSTDNTNRPHHSRRRQNGCHVRTPLTTVDDMGSCPISSSLLQIVVVLSLENQRLINV